jgi:peptidoglycan hydrolase CwlO-like protein|tara:strand:- start:461 stop:712 length:252 start_codon:yes stop_codon:yes gene_type:complete
MLEQLAKLQTQNRNLTKQVKKQDSLIRERDQEITDLRKKVEDLEQSERNKAKNQSYIHAKALKDIEQKNENERKHDTKDGRKK